MKFKSQLKDFTTRILLKLPVHIRYNIVKIKNIFNFKKVYKQRKYIKKLAEEYQGKEEDGIIIKDSSEWGKKFNEYALFSKDATEFAEMFFKIKIYKIGNKENLEQDNSPVLICVVKNDLLRIKLILKYYRKLGIKHFAILDDKSTDGTKEYLQQQLDVDLFESNVGYTTLIRQVWINRITDFYGIDRWYLIVDSDELLSYYDMEKCDVNKIIEYLDKCNVSRMRTILLDMYADSIEPNDSIDNIEKKYCYFDSENIYNIANIKFKCIAGGVRCRIFSERNNEFKPYLTKYPLIKYKKEDIICNSHYLFPYDKNFKTDCLGVLRHYKFMDGDMQKYKERMVKGNFEKGSKQYKMYMKMYEKSENFTFCYDKSEKWIDSNSLKKLPFVKKGSW